MRCSNRQDTARGGGEVQGEDEGEGQGEDEGEGEGEVGVRVRLRGAMSTFDQCAVQPSTGHG